MLISLDWIRDYVDLPADLNPRELAERFTCTTAEVEEVKQVAIQARGLIIARVNSATELPGSRNLRLVMLDIGSGTGDVAREVVRRKSVRCVHLDRRKLLFCKPPAPLLLCDGEDIALRGDSMDTVLLITMLHHCSDPAKVLREAKRVCRGRILVVEDVFSSRLGRLLTIVNDALLNLEWDR